MSLGGTVDSDEAEAFDRVLSWLRFDYDQDKTWIYAKQIERDTGLDRATVEDAMGRIEQRGPWELTREEVAGEIRWRVET
jgi:hypothetical protein